MASIKSNMSKATYQEGDRIKNPKITAASNGYVLTCDLYRKSEGGTYDGECYVGEHMMVFNSNEGNKAIETLTQYAKSAGLLQEPPSSNQEAGEKEK